MEKNSLFKTSVVTIVFSVLTGVLVRIICKNTYRKRLDMMSRIFHDDDEDDYSF